MSTRADWQQHLLSAVDKALGVADGVADRRLAALRRANPDMTPSGLITALEREFTVAVAATGSGTGLVAAVPAVGTPAAVGVAGADLVTFLTAAAAHTLAVARIHGATVTEVEHQRALVLAVLLGNAGAKVVMNSAGHVGVRWGQAVAATLPLRIIKELNVALGGLLLKKFGPRAGIVTVAKVTPLGLGAVIGGAGNLVLAREVVRSSRAAFGEPPATFDDAGATRD